MPQDWMPKSASPFVPSPGEIEVPDDFKNDWRSLLHRFAFGATEEDKAIRRKKMLAGLSDKGKEEALQLEKNNPKYRIGMTSGPESEPSILPHISHEPETYWGGFTKSLYEDFVRPFGTPSGILSRARPAKLPPLEGIERGIPRLGMDTGYKLDRPLGLPAAGESGAGPVSKTRFFGGSEGVADATQKYKVDTGQNPDLFSGTIKPSEFGELTDIDAINAANRKGMVPRGSTGTVGRLGEIRQIRPAETAEDVVRQIETSKVQPTQINPEVKPKAFYPKTTSPVVELPSAVKSFKPKTAEPVPATPKVSTPVAAPVSTTAKIANQLRPIADDTPVRDATLQWANGRDAAKIRGANAAAAFSDLIDPKLIHAYEAGDRTGKLAQVQKFFDTRYQQAVDMGLLKEDQKRLNYLRHYFEQDPEAVTEAFKNYIAKNPKFAKTGKFQTYAQAQEAGLTPKFNSIPEIVAQYEDEFHKAVRNKEFYDYLQKTGRLAKGAIDTSPTEWKFKGDDAKELAKYIKGYFSESPDWLSKVANVFRYTKNLSLGSGIPKTPLNIHYYNTARSAYYGRGMAGVEDYLSGTFNPEKDVNFLKANRNLIADLAERGYGATNIEDHSTLAREALKDPNWVEKIKNFQGSLFEDPLFKIRLPAAKLAMAKEIVEKETPKIGREAALKLAAGVSNDFMGGLNNVLRHKTTKDLLSIGLLAPDWLESRANLAVKGMKALVGKEAPVYRQALARKAAVAGVGAAATAAITGSPLNPSNRSSNITAVPLGKTSTGKNRELPLFSTTAEEIRLPAELIAAAKNKDESTFEKLGNLTSGRMSIPLRSLENVRSNTDAFGNKLYGHDKYGQPISTGRSTFNVGKELATPFIPPWVLMFRDLMSGEDPEAAISRGIELPLNYNTERRPRF